MTLRLIPAAFAAATLMSATAVSAAPETYVLDPSHSQVVFSYNHLGYSTTTGMFSGFEGEIALDAEDPAASSVNVSMPVLSMFTGWEARDGHFMSEDFFGAAEGDLVSFNSTGIEVTGGNTALITGTLSMNGVEKEVVLDTVLNAAGTHPMENKEWAGFTATTTLLRSDFGLGLYAPYVSDEVAVMISVEAMKAE
ncbi:YceI family protein [Aliiruegeria lutimaris]|uniref:Polyisoprenoid-binding protein YceI n=1 Tax=Aliiruegeria lutimaris TaxID=571298 RepID=A0A1G8KYB8_9RHOB|nr:YceI family protein [Aliiruegeria lutimaris]SDI48424.1 Polyisoprenoid-binding protein YceI [Aliiruegeria lutimaris]